MGRPPNSKNKPKGEAVQTNTAEHQTSAPPREASAGQDVAIFQPARLPYHPAVEERFGLDKGTWKVLVEAIFPAAKSVDSIVMALSYCKSRGLDIMKRPVHIVPMYDSARGGYVETIWPGISELRTTASRTKGYAGCDVAEFGPEKTEEFKGRVKRNGNWVDEGVSVTYPTWCRMTVYRIVDGQRCKFVGPKVSWLETYATQGPSDLPNKMWQERPEGQLEKCAEAAALRRAFPEEIGNELTAEEMIGRNLHDADIATGPATSDAPPAAARDQGPPRQIAGPRDATTADVQAENDALVTEEARDGTPPPRTAKPADPISSGPPRTAAPAKQTEPPRAAAKDTGPSEKLVTPHKISGTGESYETWSAKYIDLIKTSEDTATAFKWIDANNEPLERINKGKPSVYASIRKATDGVMQALKDAQKKAEEKVAKKAKPAEPPAGDMDDGSGDMGGDAPTTAPSNPEEILATIEAELAAVDDPDMLQQVWDTAVEPLLAKLEFPPDIDLAQAKYDAHSRRLGGD